MPKASKNKHFIEFILTLKDVDKDYLKTSLNVASLLESNLKLATLFGNNLVHSSYLFKQDHNINTVLQHDKST